MFLNCDSDFIRQELDMRPSEEISADDTDEYLDFTPNYCFSMLPDGHIYFKNYKTTGKTVLGPRLISSYYLFCPSTTFKMSHHEGRGNFCYCKF